jgi:hypothetical protein
MTGGNTAEVALSSLLTIVKLGLSDCTFKDDKKRQNQAKSVKAFCLIDRINQNYYLMLALTFEVIEKKFTGKLLVIFSNDSERMSNA